MRQIYHYDQNTIFYPKILFFGSDSTIFSRKRLAAL